MTSRPTSPDRPWPLRALLWLFRASASLQLAVTMIVTYIVVLVWTTGVMSYWYGPAALQWGIYGAWWFVALNALLGLNVLNAALIRFPWKVRQTGFLVTHLGILVLLFGCVVSFRDGVQATLQVVENGASHSAIQESHRFELRVAAKDARHGLREAVPIAIPFDSGPFNWDDYGDTLSWFPWGLMSISRGLVYDRDGIQLEVLDYCSDSRRASVPQITLQTQPPREALRGASSDELSTTLTLTVLPDPQPHGGARPYGMGQREGTPQGHRINFWMTGSRAETEAFLHSRPEGALGKLGQVVLWAGGRTFRFQVDDWPLHAKKPLGDTGLQVELIATDQSAHNVMIPGVQLAVHRGGEPPSPLSLYATLPQFNVPDRKHDVYGSYWLDETAPHDADEPGDVQAESRRDVQRPRVDILQGYDQALYVRTWRSPQVDVLGPWPASEGELGGAPLTVFEKTKDELLVKLLSCTPSAAPGWQINPRPYKREPKQPRQPRAKVRLTLDGQADEFWVAGPTNEFQDDQQQVAESDRRRAVLTMPQNVVDLGFEVFLHRFDQILDPGARMPSYFGSLVDFRAAPKQPGGPPGAALERDVEITLNAPIDFADPATGRSYRLFQSSFQGPWKPGSADYERNGGQRAAAVVLLGVQRQLRSGPRAEVRRLAVDRAGHPHRVLHEDVLFGNDRPCGSPVAILVLICGCLTAAPATAADALQLDWDAWERLPVLEGGRRMPLDTFARTTVETVCGRESPTLWLPEADVAANNARPDEAAAKPLFPDGRPRTFRASELIFSWLVEPQRWQAVPFLVADHKQLRADLLTLPRYDAEGRRLRYASPWTVENSQLLHGRIADLQARQQQAEENDEKWQPVGVNRAVQLLVEGYNRWSEFSGDPATARGPSGRFTMRQQMVMKNLRQVGQELNRGHRLNESDPLGKLLVAAFDQLNVQMHPPAKKKFSWRDTERGAAALSRACEELENRCAAENDAALTIVATDAARNARQAHLALYDSAVTLRLVPALEPGALEPGRDPSDDSQPWLGLRAMLFGSDDLLRGYPQAELKSVRAAFEQAKRVYLDRDNPQRREQFAAAMNEFVAAVGTLGDTITPQREALPIRQKDEHLLALTAYPPAGFTDEEVFYNRLNPFFWSWIVGAIAVFCLAITFGVLRQPMFWLGVLVLLASQAIALTGFTLRMLITGLLPLTNMFESVAFVAMCVALFGVWFALLPMIWPGLKLAWRSTAAPLTPEAAALDENYLALLRAETWPVVNAVMLVPRLALVAVGLYLMARTPWTPHGYFDLVPQFPAGASVEGIVNNLVVWFVGLCVLALGVYYLPRLVLALMAAVVWCIPASWRHTGLARPVGHVLDRRLFAIVGAVVALLAAALAYYAPNTVMDKDISTARPVLRDNFWLFVHVLTICASYAAGALAWGLSNIALGHYLLGRYRGGLPPSPCAALAHFTYKATQVAVLLLAAGTILGALWADKAWGRFWSWDAKEVWSLLTLLAYMAILHSRHAGWVGNFGLSVGSVLGATFIVFAWYGVNFILPSGLHSYGGGGAGGQWAVVACGVMNWVFVLAAAFRYAIEMRQPVPAEAD